MQYLTSRPDKIDWKRKTWFFFVTCQSRGFKSINIGMDNSECQFDDCIFRSGLDFANLVCQLVEMCKLPVKGGFISESFCILTQISHKSWQINILIPEHLFFSWIELRIVYGTFWVRFKPVHRGAFFQFLFRWIHYCHSSKSTGKETGKTHLCAVLATFYGCWIA